MASVWKLSVLCGARGGRGEGPAAGAPSAASRWAGRREESSAGGVASGARRSSSFPLAALAPVETTAATPRCGPSSSRSASVPAWADVVRGHACKTCLWAPAPPRLLRGARPLPAAVLTELPPRLGKGGPNPRAGSCSSRGCTGPIR